MEKYISVSAAIMTIFSLLFLVPGVGAIQTVYITGGTIGTSSSGFVNSGVQSVYIAGGSLNNVSFNNLYATNFHAVSPIISGNLTIGDGYSSGGSTLFSTGDAWFNGDILLSGQLLTVNTIQVNGSNIPTINNQFDLGNSSNKLKDYYGAGWLNATNLNTTGTSFVNNIQSYNWVNSTNLNISSGMTVSGGKVGINTLDPLRALYLKETWTQSAVIGFADTDNTEIGTIGVARATNDIVTGTVDLDLVIKSFSGSKILFTNARGTDMVVDAWYHRVGIGTTTPQSVLHVNGTGNLLNVSNSTHSFLFIDEASGRVGIGTTGPLSTLEVSGNLSVSGSTNSSIDSGTLFIDATNNKVGIGTTALRQSLTSQSIGVGNDANYSAPGGASKLVIAEGQTASEELLTLWRSRATQVAGPSIGLYGSRGSMSSPSSMLSDYPLGDISFYHWDGSAWNKGAIITALVGKNNDPDTGYLTFSTSNAASTLATRMIIDEDGNVGINTTTPTSLLHVSGSNSLLNVSNSTTQILSVNDTSGGFVVTATNSKFCLNGATCSHYITYNGTYTVIQ